MERGPILDSNLVWYLRTMPVEFQIRGTSLKLSLWVVLAFSSLFLDFAHSCPIGCDLTFRLYISSKWIFQYFTVLNYLNSKFRVQKEHDENMWQTFDFTRQNFMKKDLTAIAFMFFFNNKICSLKLTLYKFLSLQWFFWAFEITEVILNL